MYQSHKGWTSNVLRAYKDMGYDSGINPTRGGRQTGDSGSAPILRALYQSHKGWTSNG